MPNVPVCQVCQCVCTDFGTPCVRTGISGKAFGMASRSKVNFGRLAATVKFLGLLLRWPKFHSRIFGHIIGKLDYSDRQLWACPFRSCELIPSLLRLRAHSRKW